jgi:mRNA interferase RelE/StbE
MAEYSVLFKESAAKDFRDIPKKDARNILERISGLRYDPRPQGSEKLFGEDKYRLRWGRYRVIYSIQDDSLTIWVVKVAERKDVYRKR